MRELGIGLGHFDLCSLSFGLLDLDRTVDHGEHLTLTHPVARIDADRKHLSAFTYHANRHRAARGERAGRFDHAANRGLAGCDHGHNGGLSVVIARGDRMGARLGWPTINLQPENELLPNDGVYIGRVHLPSYPGSFDGVTNIGTRPTVYENYQRVVETHILGFKADIYGERVTIDFQKRLREEKMFSSVMELSAQIGRDVEATREFFAAQRRLEDA